MYLSASAVAVSTKGRYNKCSTFTFTSLALSKWALNHHTYMLGLLKDSLNKLKCNQIEKNSLKIKVFTKERVFHKQCPTSCKMSIMSWLWNRALIRGPATVNAQSLTDLLNVWQMAASDNWCHKSIMYVGREDQRKRVVPDTAVHFRVTLCMSAQPRTLDMAYSAIYNGLHFRFHYGTV